MVPIRPGEDPSVKTSKKELTRGVVIAYVDDLLLTGWQHHIDAITKALLVKYVMKKSGALPEGKPETENSSGGIDFLGARISSCAMRQSPHAHVHLQTSSTMLVTCVTAPVYILRQLKPFLSQERAKGRWSHKSACWCINENICVGSWSGTSHSMMFNIVPQTTKWWRNCRED